MDININHAIANGDLDFIKVALQGADIDELNRYLCSASCTKHTHIVRWFINQGADVNHAYDFPILLSSVGNYLETVQVLLEHGACVNYKDKTGINKFGFNGGDSLLIAKKLGHTEIVSFLLDCNVCQSEYIDPCDAYERRMLILKRF